MNQCDQGHSTSQQVRVLPFGNGNLILCYKHFNDEIAYRKSENEEKFRCRIDRKTLQVIPNPSAYDLPAWQDLKVYDPE
jgi:hypothetical protein